MWQKLKHNLNQPVDWKYIALGLFMGLIWVIALSAMVLILYEMARAIIYGIYEVFIK